MTYGQESAFPEISDIPQFNNRTYGLTKREYFSAMAMQGLIAHGYNAHEYKDAATYAVNAADALITALNQNNK